MSHDEKGARSAGRPKVIILSQYDMPPFKRNMNAYQRITYGAEYAEIVFLVRRKAIVSSEIESNVRVRRAPFHNRLLFFWFCVLFAGVIRLRGFSIIFTEPSGFAGVGLLAKYAFGYRWVLDVWDRPRWRTGYHERYSVARLSDRFVFWTMKYADLYLLSVMREAARDIQIDPGKTLMLFNAIDQSLVAPSPPQRTPSSAPLEVAFARSKFHWTVGLGTLIEAAEILYTRGRNVRIHLVGIVSPEDRDRITRSPASDMIEVHGFIDTPRVEFFRKVHVGLVTYEPYEDMSFIYPIKVLEHLSQGNPVIVSDLSGLKTMITHKYNGLVVEPRSPVELANAIELLEADSELYHVLSTNSLESISRFDVTIKTKMIFKRVACLHDGR